MSDEQAATVAEVVDPPKVPVHTAWSRVMGDVQAVGKNDRNKDQGFNFRGIDAVLNAVGPALRAHGVVVLPRPVSMEVERYQSKSDSAMKNVTVQMEYRVIGPSGDDFTGSSYGEAADSSDKAVAKAQSVAYRVFLIQSLTIPTHEPDPDANSHERAGVNSEPQRAARPQSEAETARIELGRLVDRLGIDRTAVGAEYYRLHGVNIEHVTDPAPIRALAEKYRSENAASNGVPAEGAPAEPAGAPA